MVKTFIILQQNSYFNKTQQNIYQNAYFQGTNTRSEWQNLDYIF